MQKTTALHRGAGTNGALAPYGSPSTASNYCQIPFFNQAGNILRLIAIRARFCGAAFPFLRCNTNG
jgi:hypothetical protein